MIYDKSKERLRIASKAMQGLLSNETLFSVLGNNYASETDPVASVRKHIANMSVKYADELLKSLEETSNE